MLEGKLQALLADSLLVVEVYASALGLSLPHVSKRMPGTTVGAWHHQRHSCHARLTHDSQDASHVQPLITER